MSEPHSYPSPSAAVFARSTSVVAILIGSLALGAWLFNLSHVKSPLLVAFVLLSTALVLLNREAWARTGRQVPPPEAESLHSTLDNLMEGCQIVDRDWRYVYLNPVAAEHGRKSVKELVGRTMLEAYPGIERTEMFRVLRRCMESRKPAAMENEFPAPDGSTGWFQLVVQPVAEGLFILSLDITERKRTETALRETQALFDAFMESSPTVKWMKDDRGRYIYVNRAWSDAFGLERQGAIGKTIVDLAPGPSAVRITEAEQEVLRRNEPIETIDETNSGGKKRIWSSVRFPFRGPSGEPFVGGIAIDITARTQAEAALRASEAQFEVVIENLEEGLVIADTAGNIRHLNPAGLRLLGLSASEDWRRALSLLGDTFEFATADGTLLPFEQWPINRILAGETLNNVEQRVRRKDEPWERFFSFTGAIARYSDDESLAFVTINDVTERRRSEDQLREAHAQLREFLDHSPAVLYALKIDGERIVPRLVSENITRLLGYEKEETLSLEWWTEQIHPDDRARAEAGMSEALSRGTSRTEYRLRHKAGSYSWVEDTRRLVRDASGRPAELVGATLDINERRQAQDELRESERRFRDMLGNLDLIAMMLDNDACITYCNDYLVQLSGWRREELLGKDWLQTFIPQEVSLDLHAAFASLLSDAPQFWHHENEITTRSGKRRLIRWNNSLLRSASGEVIGTASIGEDVTDERNLEKQMLRTQRLESLGALAGGIAHDMNNMLMPILMGVTLLKRFEPSERSLKAIENIEQSVGRGRDLVNQVLLFARGTDTERKPVDLKEVVREVAAIIIPTFPKDITVGEISISAAKTEVSEQYANAHGGASAGPYVVLTVSDTGEGIPSEILDRIFEPFFTTKEVGKGTGIGLSTVQGIVGSHGGFITVSSTVGAGSTFNVHLPAKTAGPGKGRAVENAEPLAGGHGELIMVVDDDASVLLITKQALEAFGYRVITAADGARAIGLFSPRHSEIAAVVTDMAMPVMDGPTLVAALQRIDPGVRVVATTGSGSPAYQRKLAKAGVRQILHKPYTADDLLRTVADSLAERSRTRDRA
jgi:PAS domain S-box-containing protein